MIKRHVNSLFNSVCYSLGSVLIDPGDEWEGFGNVEAVLLTHAHFDHIYGLNRVLELNPKARIYTNSEGLEALLSDKLNLSRYHESPFTLDYPGQTVAVNDGEEVELGNGLVAKAMFTPGHNPSCITWIIGDDIFTGDSYIPGIKTVTNLPRADKAKAKASEELILTLARNKTIHPGHKL